MENYSHIVDKNGHSIEHPDNSKKVNEIEKVQYLLAEKLDRIAETIHQKTARSDEQSEIASYGKEASHVLHQSADYIREFDYEKADADVRGYIQEQPGKSILIAGGVGLLLGIFFRRK